ncbi:MAG TPA: hypothetical protein VG797_02115 [Phycisphaerales bacterium]|nr:hypothetical protein [Phycisphaerales bacterium]
MPFDVPLFVERFLAPLLIIVGLSHIIAARQWVAFFNEILPKPWAGLAIGMFTLPLGLAIAISHNIWVPHFPVVTTIIGWGMSIKGALYLLIPGLPARVAGKLMNPATMMIGGLIAIVLGVVILIGAYFLLM